MTLLCRTKKNLTVLAEIKLERENYPAILVLRRDKVDTYYKFLRKVTDNKAEGFVADYFPLDNDDVAVVDI